MGQHHAAHSHSPGDAPRQERLAYLEPGQLLALRLLRHAKCLLHCRFCVAAELYLDLGHLLGLHAKGGPHRQHTLTKPFFQADLADKTNDWQGRCGRPRQPREAQHFPPRGD
jgi:hypothetical protein